MSSRTTATLRKTLSTVNCIHCGERLLWVEEAREGFMREVNCPKCGRLNTIMSLSVPYATS